MKGFPPFTGPAGSPPPPSSDPIALLNYALTHGGVQIVDFAGSVRRVRTVSRNGARSAVLLVDAPEGVGKDLQGPAEERDCYLLIHIERSVADEMDDPSPIILLPGGGRAIQPPP